MAGPLRSTRAVSASLTYEIDLRPDAFGFVVGEPTGARCHELIYSKKTVCVDCPVAHIPHVPRRVRRDPGEPARLEVLEVRLVGDHQARVQRTSLDGEMLSELVALRLLELSVSAGLTERERAVLGHLAAGTPYTDIATSLDLTPRTVKFHVANVLRKLGADSRADLLRLLLRGGT